MFGETHDIPESIGIGDLPAEVMRCLRRLGMVVKAIEDIHRTRSGRYLVRMRRLSLWREELMVLNDCTYFSRIQHAGSGCLLMVFDPTPGAPEQRLQRLGAMINQDDLNE